MPTAVTDLPPKTDPPRKRWTREEYRALSGPGFEHIELVEGELIDKMGKRAAHVLATALLNVWLIRVFGPLFVRKEDPIDVSPGDQVDSEPEPDLVVTGREIWSYAESHPRPSDIRLVVEVADTTLGFDLTTKAQLYARAGIVEYWVVDIPSRRIVVHREPADGQYRKVAAYAQNERVAPLAAPASELLVADVFAF